MTWAKGLIIALGLVLLTCVAHAREIERFTDSQGTLHITNLGPKKPGNLANSPSPAAPFRPGSSPGNPPVTPSALELTPKAQTPAPLPKTAPAGSVSADPQPGPRVSHAAGPGGVRPVTGRTGEQGEPGMAAEAPALSLKRVSWSPPQPLSPSPNGKIAIHRDRHGVIHITNVPLEEPSPAGPLIPASVVQRRGPPPDAALPAVQPVSCPELGPEVADYLEAKLRDASPASTGQTIRRHRDSGGVWHIANEPAPDLQLPEAPLAASAGKLTVAASAHGPPATPTPPAMAWGPGLVRPPAAPPDQGVVARRDRRGVLHISTRASAQFMSDRNSPGYFLGRVSPALQACIIEAAQLYRLPTSLILALIQQESNFVHQAVSPKGAMGLMQLMPGTAASLGVRDPFHPRENILAGCRYFRFLLDYFRGNLPLALAGYNAGHNRVISAGFQVPAIKETQEFVTQVMGLYYLLEKHASGL